MIDAREPCTRAASVLGLPAGRGARTLLAIAATAGAGLAGCDGGEDEVNEELEAGRAANGGATVAVVGDRAAAEQDGAATETDVATFTRAAPAGGSVDGEGPQGRLPAEGDLAIYIAATELFPGTARIAPEIINPYAGDEQAIAAGERHFAAFNCAGCHAPLGGGGMGPPLSDADWIYGNEPAQIYLSIMHGRPEGMPAWSSMLPRKTAWELIAYVETLDEIDDYAAEKGFESRDPLGGTDGRDDDGAGETSAAEGDSDDGVR